MALTNEIFRKIMEETGAIISFKSYNGSSSFHEERPELVNFDPIRWVRVPKNLCYKNTITGYLISEEEYSHRTKVWFQNNGPTEEDKLNDLEKEWDAV